MALQMLQIKQYYQILIKTQEILKKNYSQDSDLLYIAIVVIANVEFPINVNIPCRETNPYKAD